MLLNCNRFPEALFNWKRKRRWYSGPLHERGRLKIPRKISRSIFIHTVFCLPLESKTFIILGDPGADSGDEGKSKRAEKYIWTKKSKERREEPLGTMSYQTSSKQSPPFCLLIGARKLVFFWHQSEGRTAATVWNWSGETLSPGALLAVLYFSSFHIYFSARLDFPLSPLSAPGSPRMDFHYISYVLFPVNLISGNRVVYPY